MQPVQIYTILNSMAEQALGMKDLEATDTSFISIGKIVISSDKNKDAIYKTMVDRIGRTVMAIRTYKSAMPEMAREPFEYGAILQKISFQLAKADKNGSWVPQDEENINPFAKTEIEVMQMFFDKWTAWQYPGTIYDNQLETAFTNAGSMAAFWDGIFQSMYNALEIAYENIGNLARGSLIGSVISLGDGTACKCNLLRAYYEEQGIKIPLSDCFGKNLDFLKFASMKMGLTSDQMEKMSQTFNLAKWQRFTPKDKQVFEVQSNFAKILDTYLQSDVYHNELTKLQNYRSVPYWQGSGELWKLEDVTAINVTIEVPDGDATKTVTVEQPYVLACLRDIDSCGTTIDKRRTKSLYNPEGEYTNYWLKAELGQFRDASENVVIFYVEDFDVETQTDLGELTEEV